MEPLYEAVIFRLYEGDLASEEKNATKETESWMGEPLQGQDEPVYKQTGCQTQPDHLWSEHSNFRFRISVFFRISPSELLCFLFFWINFSTLRKYFHKMKLIF